MNRWRVLLTYAVPSGTMELYFPIRTEFADEAVSEALAKGHKKAEQVCGSELRRLSCELDD